MGSSARKIMLVAVSVQSGSTACGAAVLFLLIVASAVASSPDRSEEELDLPPAIDPGPAFEQYTSRMARDIGAHSSGSGMESFENLSADYHEFHASRILRPGIELFQVCGTVVDGDSDPALPEALQAACEAHFLVYMKRFMEPAERGPYRVPAISEVTWQEQFVTLSTNQMALFVEGRYSNPDQPAPCIRTADCCNVEALNYLDSCFAPDDNAWGAIAQCEQLGLSSSTDQDSGWQQCLRSFGVKVGCEYQPDGSRICY